MSNYKHLNIAQEAIEFQSGAFFKEMTAIYAPFVGRSDLKNSELVPLNTALKACIERHTGIVANITVDNWDSCFEIIDMDSNHPLLGEIRPFFSSNDGIKIINKAKTAIKGSVNLKTGRIDGDFKKIVPNIHISKAHFGVHRMSAEEIAAITLHEIGHFHSYLEMLGRTVIGNFVLIGLDRVLRHGADIKERHIAIEKAGQAMEFKGDTIECMKNAADDKTVITLFISAMTNEMRTENGHSFYDHNSWEMAADQFATRHGAGRALVTGLDRVYKQYGHNVSMSRPVYYMLEIWKTIQLIAMLGGVVASLATLNPAGVMVAIFFAAASYGMVVTDYQNGGAPAYDKPLDRAMRMRRQLVEHLKNPNLPKQVIKSLAEDIAMIDATVKDYTQYKTWFETIDEFLFKSSRLRADSAKLQKELEKLAINDLFLSAAKIRHV